MQTKLAIVFLCVISFFIYNNGDNAFGADFYKSNKEFSYKLKICSTDILIYGDIEKGDAQKFKNLVQNIKQENCLVGKVSLLSHGGDVFEAMQIGSLIRKNLISTEAPLAHQWVTKPLFIGCSSLCDSFINIKPCLLKNRDRETTEPRICGCNSACFLIWSAGVERMGNGLGLHRPYFSKDYFQGLSAKEAEEKYDELSNDVREYLISMDIPAHIIDEMFSHNSEDIYYLVRSYEEDYTETGFNISALKFVPFFEEWIISKCGLGCTINIFEEDLSNDEVHDWFMKSSIYNECVDKAKADVQLDNKD